uniref:Right-handed parallel beta-helix repeat-containing protein n=1 Tax=Prevotella sp. GTC17253 TaxID=3236793 RepID=A0AB33IMW4_9BACT
MRHKRLLFIAILAFCCSLYVQAQSADTVNVAQFGARANSFQNCVKAIRKAIDYCRTHRVKVLTFDNGRYDIWPEGAEQRDFYISNTSSEIECPTKTKVIGLLIDSIQGLTIEGNGATLMYHGKMTMLSAWHSSDIRLRNLHFDFERPGGSELTYIRQDNDGVVVKLHRDSRYTIINHQLQLIGEGWRSNRNHCIEYNPETQHFQYTTDFNKILAPSKVEEVSPGILKFHTPATFRPQIGNTLTIRDIIRDQVGMFLAYSRNITLQNVYVHYMHGLGIVSQFTRNITMDSVYCEPREGSGRLLASSADFMHFSGCAGKITVTNCRYAGAQDDCINVHGTNLRIIRKLDNRTLELRFMHPQTYGFDAFFPGDTVAFIRSARMIRYGQCTVKATKVLNPRTIELVLDRDIPADVELNHDCIENLTWTPEVEIRNNFFSRTSTRGILVTTPRKAVIANNTFMKTAMSGILIESDAEGWFESGPVTDVLIEGNTFIDCGFKAYPAPATIVINPSNKVVDPKFPVHKNIRIIGNTFSQSGNPVLYAKSVSGLKFKNNTINWLTPLPKNKKEIILMEKSK